MSTTNQYPVLLRVDFSETDSAYLVETDISHLHVETVDVDVWQDSLIVQMKTRRKQGSSTDSVFYSDKPLRSVIPLGISMTRAALTSEFNDGSLVVRINKTSIAVRSPRVSLGSF